MSTTFAQSPPAPAGPIGWPPKLEVNQVWVITIEGMGTWELRLSGLDTDGDPVGTARAQTKEARDLQAFFYFKQADDQAYLALTDGATMTLCTFDPKSLKGETMFGATFTRTKTDTAFKPTDKVCAASLDPLAQLGINLNPASTSSAGPWPPRLQIGQAWRVTIPGRGAWNVTLSGTDANGNPVGTAAPQGGGTNLDAFFYLAQLEGNAVLQLSDGSSIIGCVFGRGSLSGTTLTGAVVKKADPNAPFENTSISCTAVLSGGPSAAPTEAGNPPSANPPSAPTPSAPNPPTANPSASSAAVWPPRIVIGQIWTVDLGKTRYDLALTHLVNAQPSGPATTGKIRADATFYFDPKTNRATLEIAGAATIQVCSFDAKSPRGASYVGTVAYKTSKNGPPKPINGSCIATQLRPGTSSILEPFENTVLAHETAPDGLFALLAHETAPDGLFALLYGLF